MNKILFLDIETTGLNKEIHEIIEIAGVLYDDDTGEELARYHTKIKPVHIETAMPEALVINNYSEENWKDAIELKEALINFSPLYQDVKLTGGHNLHFDEEFIKYNFEKNGLIYPSKSYRKIDTLFISWLIGNASSAGRGNSLQMMADLFETKNKPDHSALNDVLTTAEIAFKYRRTTKYIRENKKG